jgi:hypothetical protein
MMSGCSRIAAASASARVVASATTLTDEFLLFAIESGLLKTWAEAFPDPRGEPEIGMEVVLPAHLAARFAGLYSMRKAGYVLRSARVLGALGYSVEVIEPAHGLSVRGTSDDKLFSGDVVRKLLVQMERQADLSQPACLLPQELRVAVKVRERASRRALKQTVDAVEAEARAQKAAEHLVDWYNQHVGVSMLKYARLGKGRRIHILDTTHVEVALETGRYECSGVVKNEDGTYARGYKLATLRTLLDSAGLLSQVALSAIHVHDVALCRPLLEKAPVLRPGKHLTRRLLTEATGNQIDHFVMEKMEGCQQPGNDHMLVVARIGNHGDLLTVARHVFEAATALDSQLNAIIQCGIVVRPCPIHGQQVEVWRCFVGNALRNRWSTKTGGDLAGDVVPHKLDHAGSTSRMGKGIVHIRTGMRDQPLGPERPIIIGVQNPAGSTKFP